MTTRPTLSRILLFLVCLGLVACGSGAGEEGGDAEGAAAAQRPDTGALPDAPAPTPPATRPEAEDTLQASGGAVPGAPAPEVPAPEVPAAPPQAAAARPDTLVGVVGTFGADPLVQFVLQTEDQGPVPLGNADGVTRPEAIPAHPLAELARLTGATVRVVGQAGAFPAVPGPGFAVEAYEIVEIEGERPFAGTLVRGDPETGTPDRLESRGAAPGGARDAASTSRVVVGMPPGTPATGSVVWVVAETRGDTLLVSGYGVLRPAGP